MDLALQRFAEINPVEVGNVNPLLLPPSPLFEANILAAAASDLNKPTGSFGAFAFAWWNVKGLWPRVGEIGVKIVGEVQPGIPAGDEKIQVPEGGRYVRWNADEGKFELRDKDFFGD